MDIDAIAEKMDFSKITETDQEGQPIGLVDAIAQCYDTSQVLMKATMSEETLRETIETGIATYWSRSRKERWMKGETSGNYQKVVEMYFDCDCDTVLLKVRQLGTDGACHKQDRYSCFDNGRVI